MMGKSRCDCRKESRRLVGADGQSIEFHPGAACDEQGRWKPL